MTNEPSALDRAWVSRLSDRAVTSKTSKPTKEGGSVIHCQSYTFNGPVYFIMPAQQQSGSSGLTWVLAILFWGWFFASLILH